MIDKKALRRDLRARRRGITGKAAEQASLEATARLMTTRAWQRARRIALYLPADGEIDTLPIMLAAWQQRKTVYLPVIRPPASGLGGGGAARTAGHLIFRRYCAGEPLRPGLLGIPEPLRGISPVIALAQLDLLIMPLVGFDASGYRLGMGGGFYDRTLANRSATRRPVRIGMGYDVQKVDELPVDPWDIAMDACVTNREIVFW